MKYELAEIREIRRHIGINQSELAKLAGVSQSLIAKIESKKIDPAYSKVEKIFQAMSSLRKKEEVNVEKIIKKDIITISPKAPVTKAIALMKKHAISQIPVAEGEKILGLITETLVVAHFGKDYSKLKVEEIMEDSPPVISKNTSIGAVSDLLRYFPIVIVSEKGKILGIVTKADILKSIR